MDVYLASPRSQAQADKVNGMPQTSDAIKYYMRRVIGSAVECEIDKQGRVLVAPALRVDAVLNGEVPPDDRIDAYYAMWLYARGTRPMLPEAGELLIIPYKYNSASDTLLVIGSTTGITATKIPNNFYLHQNYPNPFNPFTNIRFGLANRVKVKLEIFNILGQKVKTILNKNMPAGKYELQWNGLNDSKKRVSSGVYFYRLITEDKKFIVTRKMLLLK